MSEQHEPRIYLNDAEAIVNILRAMEALDRVLESEGHYIDPAPGSMRLWTLHEWSPGVIECEDGIWHFKPSYMER